MWKNIEKKNYSTTLKCIFEILQMMLTVRLVGLCSVIIYRIPQIMNCKRKKLCLLAMLSMQTVQSSTLCGLTSAPITYPGGMVLNTWESWICSGTTMVVMTNDTPMISTAIWNCSYQMWTHKKKKRRVSSVKALQARSGIYKSGPWFKWSAHPHALHKLIIPHLN